MPNNPKPPVRTMDRICIGLFAFVAVLSAVGTYGMPHNALFWFMVGNCVLMTWLAVTHPDSFGGRK